MTAKIHPVLKQVLDLGCTNQRTAPTAFAVYMDLAEVKAVWDLRYEFCKELDIIYLTGKENELDLEPNVYLPLPASCTASPEWLHRVQNTLPTKSKGITLAFKDADSTIVYYCMSEGLVTPDAPEVVQKKKSTEEKRRLIHSELWRKRSTLYETAKRKSNDDMSC